MKDNLIKKDAELDVSLASMLFPSHEEIEGVFRLHPRGSGSVVAEMIIGISRPPDIHDEPSDDLNCCRHALWRRAAYIFGVVADEARGKANTPVG